MEKIEIEGKSIYLYSHQIDMRMGMEKIQVLYTSIQDTWIVLEIEF